jgi:hypothetical protein
VVRVGDDESERLKAQLALSEARAEELRRLLVVAYTELDRRTVFARAADAARRFRLSAATKIRRPRARRV